MTDFCALIAVHPAPGGDLLILSSNERKEREREIHTVSFHNFKSQNFKLSVSNPKSKYVAYLSVLSQISNCQGLGRKNKHDILKTDRTTTTTTNHNNINNKQ